MLIGIVGKPSAGKSTFFRSATLAEAEIANYPFTTIKPNRAIGTVRIECVDKEFNKQCNPRTGFCIGHNRFVPVELLDVAGLIPGAHTGIGMGNQFLDDLRQADVLIHIIDAAGLTNEKGEPVPALSYDPCKDVEFLVVEIEMWMLGIVQKNWDRIVRQSKQEQSEAWKIIAKQLSGLKVSEELVKDIAKDYPKELNAWTQQMVREVIRKVRQQTKPIVIAANKIDVPGAEENLERLKKQFPNEVIIPCSSDAELALREAAKRGLIEYIPGDKGFKIHENKISPAQSNALKMIQERIVDKFGSTGIQNVLNTAVFDILKYIAVFPGGMKKLEDSEGRTLPDCFLVPPKTTAVEFAAIIHTDLAKGFIRAIDIKKERTVGKEHILQHRDVVEIVSSK
ncbi:redox-regulated ATPase YchF [Candidatus Woesearchaeota archaeon]|nr:redox-regulated ATPase YchF [Candidatus Woesearchaeota archaeon]